MPKKRQNNHTCTGNDNRESQNDHKETKSNHKETHKDTLDGESGTKAHIDTT